MPVASASAGPRVDMDLLACGRLLRGGSKSFHAASLLLPASLREAATGLYAFCRVADDAIDSGGDVDTALQDLSRRLDLIYCGRPEAIPADRVFASVVERYGIARALPEALLEGFSWDAQGRRYATLSALQDYAARVAGSVGVMMALVMGQRDPLVLSRASDLGVAMQLTNIVRDVGDDARNARLYLPEAWMREAGMDPDAWLLEPAFDPRLATVLQRLLEQADFLYGRAAEGISWLPWRCRPGMHAARLLYAEIGSVVRENGFDSVATRAHVAWLRKLSLLPGALATSLRPPGILGGQLVETRFLTDSVSALRPARSFDHDERRGSRAEWLLELFERLQREQASTREPG